MDKTLIRKRGLFIVEKDMKESARMNSGVYKKIVQQLETFKKHYDIKLVEAYFRRTLVRRALTRLPFFPNVFSARGLKIDYKNLDFIYFRYDWGDLQTVLFLRKLKKKAPQCKIIFELPTYPLDLDKLTTKWHQKIFKYKHIFWSRFMKNYVDRAVVYGDDDYAYGIPTIKTSNGIDVDAVSTKKFTDYNSNEIRLISVSNMIKWHGIDRMITGIYQYKKDTLDKKRIRFHLVGEGREEQHLRSLVKQYNLEDEVIFHGYQFGDDLQGLYDQADIGVEVLGLHRNKKNGISSSLKSREYFAKGLPFISECQFKDDCKLMSGYILSVPADESPVDMRAVIDFYDHCYRDKPDGTTELKLHTFAKENLDINVVMKVIFEYIERAK